MKKLLSGIAIVLFSLSAVHAQESESRVNSSQQSGKVKLRQTWVLTITPQSKKAYLDSVSDTWKAHQIILKFSTLKYTSKGKLEKVRFSVVAGQGKDAASGTFKSDILQSVELTVTDPPGITIRGR